MKHYNFILILLISNFVPNFGSINWTEKRLIDDYSFILLMPQNESKWVAAIFSLTDLRVCRFPNGPMWSNSVALQEIYPVSKDCYLTIKNCSQKLHILCLDYSIFKLQCQNPCKQSVCGFALPWEPGMAYVFDDLQNIEHLKGYIIEKSKLADLKFESTIKRSQLDLSEDLDEIDFLIENNHDDQYVGKYLPYPLQDIKNFFGKIAISCLIYYHSFKQKVTKLVNSKNS